MGGGIQEANNRILKEKGVKRNRGIKEKRERERKDKQGWERQESREEGRIEAHDVHIIWCQVGTIVEHEVPASANRVMLTLGLFTQEIVLRRLNQS